MASAALAETHYQQAVVHLKGGRHALALVEAKCALDAAGYKAASATAASANCNANGYHHSARYWLALAQAAEGLELLETAYAIYAKGVRACLETGSAGTNGCNSSSTSSAIAPADEELAALRKLSVGRMEVLAAMALGKGAQSAQRSARWFSLGSEQPRLDVQVFCASDLHVDAPGGEAMAWLRGISTTRFQRDIIIVAGDVADTAPAVRSALTLLKARFGRVFYVPGNHDLWLRRDACNEAAVHADSFCKLMALRQMCDELGVETAPAEVARGLFVVPLLSWYNHTFDTHDPRPGRLQYDKFCQWPVSPLDVWQVMLKLNNPSLRPPQQQQQQGGRGAMGYKRLPDDVVITASHFLPHTGLPFSASVSELPKAVGCQELQLQLDACSSDLHVYGHTHINGEHVLGEGPSKRRYVQFAVEGAVGWGRAAAPQLCCIWDGHRLMAELVDAD